MGARGGLPGVGAAAAAIVPNDTKAPHAALIPGRCISRTYQRARRPRRRSVRVGAGARRDRCDSQGECGSCGSPMRPTSGAQDRCGAAIVRSSRARWGVARPRERSTLPRGPRGRAPLGCPFIDARRSRPRAGSARRATPAHGRHLRARPSRGRDPRRTSRRGESRHFSGDRRWFDAHAVALRAAFEGHESCS